MKLRYTVWALTLTFLAFAVMPPIASAEDDIPHFRRITEILARGGTPTRTGIRRLYNNHVLTVVDLRQLGPETAAEDSPGREANRRLHQCPKNGIRKSAYRRERTHT